LLGDEIHANGGYVYAHDDVGSKAADTMVAHMPEVTTMFIFQRKKITMFNSFFFGIL